MKAQILLILIVGLSYATESEYSPILVQIQEMESFDPYSMEIAQLLELKMKQNSPVEEVLNSLREMIGQMKADDVIEMGENAQRSGTLMADISILEIVVGRLSNQLKSANSKLGDILGEMGSLMSSQESLSRQLTTLNGRDEDIRDASRMEQQSNKAQTNNNNNIIRALTEIIDKLSQAVFTQRNGSAVLTELQKNLFIKKIREELGPSNPITLLVTMTTTFDEATVTRIIERLEAIRTSCAKTNVQIETNQVEADSQSQTILSELSDVRARLAVDLNTNRGLVTRRNNEKTILERTKNQLAVQLPSVQELLTNTRNQLETIQGQYAQRQLRRQQELRIIQQAYGLVQVAAQKIASSK